MESSSPSALSCNKQHPEYVQVGQHSIFVCELSDIRDNYEKIRGLDVFVGMDSGHRKRESKKDAGYQLPLMDEINEIWQSKWLDVVPKNIICLEVSDRGICNPIVSTLIDLLDRGLKVGVGCWHCHGRTGWVLARLIKYYEKCSGDEAVVAIRKRLCVECVESVSQIDDLECKKEVASDTYKYAATSLCGGYYGTESKYNLKAISTKPESIFPDPWMDESTKVSHPRLNSESYLDYEERLYNIWLADHMADDSWGD
jgi:hypothetical protein